MNSGSVKLSALPPEIRERIQKRMSGELDAVVMKRGGGSNKVAYIAVTAALAWFPLLYLIVNNHLWGPVTIALVSIVTLFISYILVHFGLQIFRGSSTKSYMLVTPYYLMDINGNTLDFWNLDEVYTVDGSIKNRGSFNEFTRITFGLEADSRHIDIENGIEAEDNLERIIHYRKGFIEALARDNRAFLDANDDLRGLENATPQPKSRSSKGYAPEIGTAIASVILTGVIIAGCLPLNEYFDDRNSWLVAQKNDLVASMRYYIRTHPKGRWVKDAETRIAALYDDAEQKYRAALKPGHDEKAAAAVIDVMKYARTGNSCVLVAFTRKNSIPDTTVEDLKKEYDVKIILPFGEAFSEKKMVGREGDLFTSVAAAFGQIISHDILDISTECSGESVKFLVDYDTWASDSLYVDDTQKNAPEDEKVNSIGIGIDWNFKVEIPGKPEAYTFELESQPASRIVYDSVFDTVTERGKSAETVIAANQGNFYDSMVASAFDDFRKNLVFRMGIGDGKNLNSQEKTTETPTNGTVTGTTDAGPGG